MLVYELPAMSYACRRGMLYERKRRRECSVIAGWDENVAIRIIQEFRGRIYLEHAAVPAVSGGMDAHRADPTSYHVVVLDKHRLVGTARYERLFSADHNCWAELGGFCVVPDLRGMRVVLLIIKKIRELADLFGDRNMYAHAAVETGSSSILRKLGGKVVAQYWHPEYQRSADVLEIRLDPEVRKN